MHWGLRIRMEDVERLVAQGMGRRETGRHYGKIPGSKSSCVSELVHKFVGHIDGDHQVQRFLDSSIP